MRNDIIRTYLDHFFSFFLILYAVILVTNQTIPFPVSFPNLKESGGDAHGFEHNQVWNDIAQIIVLNSF